MLKFAANLVSGTFVISFRILSQLYTDHNTKSMMNKGYSKAHKQWRSNLPVIVSSYWLSCRVKYVGRYDAYFILLCWITVYEDIFIRVVVDQYYEVTCKGEPKLWVGGCYTKYYISCCNTHYQRIRILSFDLESNRIQHTLKPSIPFDPIKNHRSFLVFLHENETIPNMPWHESSP
jgi:hypothetical protein